MTNHSMECMTTLVDCAPPPPTVLAVFVANCIRTIDSAQVRPLAVRWHPLRVVLMISGLVAFLLLCGIIVP